MPNKFMTHLTTLYVTNGYKEGEMLLRDWKPSRALGSIEVLGYLGLIGDCCVSEGRFWRPIRDEDEEGGYGFELCEELNSQLDNDDKIIWRDRGQELRFGTSDMGMQYLYTTKNNCAFTLSPDIQDPHDLTLNLHRDVGDVIGSQSLGEHRVIHVCQSVSDPSVYILIGMGVWIRFIDGSLIDRVVGVDDSRYPNTSLIMFHTPTATIAINIRDRTIAPIDPSDLCYLNGRDMLKKYIDRFTPTNQDIEMREMQVGPYVGGPKRAQ